VSLGLATCLNPERKTISNAIVHSGRDQQDWSADYKLFSRAQWDVDDLFDPSRKFWIQYYLERGWKDEPLLCAVDSSHMKKTGKKIPDAAYYRDPLSPAFHTNLLWGHECLQVSALIPVSSVAKGQCRGVPVAWKCCPRPKKPKKKNSTEEMKEYESLREKYKVPQMMAGHIEKCRQQLDALEVESRLLVTIGDGAFANKTIFSRIPKGVAWLCRTRKDMALYYPARSGSGKGRKPIYGERAPTPEELRKDQSVEWKNAQVEIGGQMCEVRYKSMSGLLWDSAGARKLKILVIAGLPYKPPGVKKKRYRQPSHLLYVGPEFPDATLIQWYIWRWEIEVNIRDEKQLLGIGEAQVWSKESVERYPAFGVALYGVLLAAAIKANGHERKDFYLPLPKWYGKKPWQRPSALEILKRLRADLQCACFWGQRKYFGGFVAKSLWPRSAQKWEKPAQVSSVSLVPTG
jgi:hypothetical protein